MDIIEATKNYENWMRNCTAVIESGTSTREKRAGCMTRPRKWQRQLSAIGRNISTRKMG